MKHCGVGKSAFLIPQFIFSADCERHDRRYAIGGLLLEKIHADVYFYADMLDDIIKGDFCRPKKYFYFAMATLYFVAVSTFGILFFNWKPFDDKYATMERN